MNRKTILFGLLATVIVATCAVRAWAGDLFAGTGTAVGATDSYYVVPHPGSGARARISYVNATLGSDVGASLKFYTSGDPLTVTNTQSTVTNFLYCGASATGLASNDVAIIYHVSANTYERVLVYSGTAGGLVTVSANTIGISTIGDKIYEETVSATIPLTTASTREINAGGGFFHIGPEGKPFLVSVVGTNTPLLNAISGQY